MLKINKKIIILIYFQGKNIFKKHSALQYQTCLDKKRYYDVKDWTWSLVSKIQILKKKIINYFFLK
jgi:hypothetical protein